MAQREWIRCNKLSLYVVSAKLVSETVFLRSESCWLEILN